MVFWIDQDIKHLAIVVFLQGSPNNCTSNISMQDVHFCIIISRLSFVVACIINTFIENSWQSTQIMVFI